MSPAATQLHRPQGRTVQLFEGGGLSLFGGIEAGGTKFVCGVGTGPDDIVTAQFRTSSPDETVGAAVDWLRNFNLTAVGIGSFGPVNPRTGCITSTPKTAWRNYDLAGVVRKGLGVPIRFDTDVNAAVLGESRWGVAQGVANCLYVTVGTGIGGGAVVGGELLHGLTHAEMGHIRIPHDRGADPFDGTCPFHGDCLEGLASGPAIEARWGVQPDKLPADHRAWRLEAEYLALGLANLICTLSPERIVIGGGVMRRAHLYEKIRDEVRRLLAGYIERLPDIVPPGLGELSGVLGAVALAQKIEETNE